MNHQEDYAKEAAQNGRHAARSGETVNPHTPGSLEYSAWEQGWDGAQEQSELITEIHRKHPSQPRKKA